MKETGFDGVGIIAGAAALSHLGIDHRGKRIGVNQRSNCIKNNGPDTGKKHGRLGGLEGDKVLQVG